MTLSDSYNHIDSAKRTPLARAGRVTFRMGAITFIAIGLLHTVTQLTTLSSDAVQAAYRAGGPIDVSGTTVDGWELFAGTSLLMGFFSIALGLSNLVAHANTPRPDGLPPAGLCVVNLATLVGVVAVGATLLGPLQLFGGLAGLVMFGLPLVASRQMAST